MSQPTTSDRPLLPIKAEAGSRWRWVLIPYQNVRRKFIVQPRGIQFMLVVSVVGALVGGSYYAWSYLNRRSSERDLAAAWSEYGAAVRKLDVEAINTALDRVLAIKPNEPTAVRYKAMLASGEADPEVYELALVFMHKYIGEDKLNEAAREAEKVLLKNPKDWQARCALAHHAIQTKGDRALAEQHLAKLPDPEDPDAGVGPGGILYALRLSGMVGRDGVSLRRVIVHRLVPVLRGGAAAAAPVEAKAQLLECYLEPFVDATNLTALVEYWAAADMLAENAVNESIAEGKVAIISRLAGLGLRMRIALGVLRDNDPNRLPEERYKQLIRAVDDRTRKAWNAVREKDPARAEAYRGLAYLSLMEDNPRGALLHVIAGLEHCGDRPELLDLLVQLEKAFGTEESLRKAFEANWNSAVAAKNDPTKWCMAANAAIAIDRRDLALAACQEALNAQPNHPAACQTAAWLLVRSGSSVDFVKARGVLLALGEAELRTKFVLARLNARLMVENSLHNSLDDEFQRVVEAQNTMKVRTVAPAVGFLLGVFDAAPDIGRSEWVATRAAQLLQSEPKESTLRQLRAIALFRLADLTVEADPETGAPDWKGDRVAAALRALEDLPAEDRTEPAIAASIALLQLKGQKNPATAQRTASALRAVENSLDAGQLEALGVVFLANNQIADAVRVLERGTRMPRPSAGLWVALAVAYHRNQQPIDAQRAIAIADNSAERSKREQLELVAAKKLLEKDNPR